MRKIFYISLILLLGNSIQISAGDSVLSEISSLFTQNVSISNYSIQEYTPAPENSTFYDNEARLLTIDERSFPYPAEIQSISATRTTEDSQLMLGVSEPLPDTETAIYPSTRSWLWFLNPETGDFSRFVPWCGEPRDFSFGNFDNPWIYLTNPETNQTRLCNPVTGNQSEVLPENLSWAVPSPFSDGSLPVFHSPERQWLLLFGEQDEQTYIFSYEIEASRLINLGSIPCNYCIEPISVKWFDTMVNIWTYFGDLHQIFSANVAQPESLDLAITRPIYAPEFYDNPPRYDYINFTTPENIWETQCQHIVYDVLSQDLQITEMGFLCRPEWGSLDSIGYYRDVSRGAEGIAVLTRFDAATGESEALFEGEIEGIDWISPDAQFAVLVLDNSGYIDTPPFRDPLFYWWVVPNEPMLAYVNLISKEILFEIRTGWKRCEASFGGPNFDWSSGISPTSLDPCSNIGSTGAIFPREAGSFLAIGDIELSYLGSDQFADLITIVDNEIIYTRLLEGSLTPFDENRVLLRTWDGAGYPSRFSYFSVDEREMIDITSTIPNDEYYVLMTEIYPSSNEIRFQITPNRDLNRSWYSADVTIRLETP